MNDCLCSVLEEERGFQLLLSDAPENIKQLCTCVTKVSPADPHALSAGPQLCHLSGQPHTDDE
jgi:hypothetical protein